MIDFDSKYLKVCNNSKCVYFCEDTPTKFYADFKYCPYCASILILEEDKMRSL